MLTWEQDLGGGLFGCGELVFMAIGALFLLRALEGRLGTRQLKRDAVTGPGVVTGYETEDHGEGATRSHPLVTYRDRAGAEHAVKVEGGREQAFRVGQVVEVLYVPGSPAEVEIVGFDPRRDHWLFALAFLGGGFLSVVMGLSI